MLTRNIPYAKHSDARVGLLLYERKLPDSPSDLDGWNDSRSELWDICQLCWKWESDERPDMEDLLGVLCPDYPDNDYRAKMISYHV